MNWQEYIHSDHEVLAGKPVVKGTRLAVDFILGLFAVGWTEFQVLENYPPSARRRFGLCLLLPRKVCGMRRSVHFRLDPDVISGE